MAESIPDSRGWRSGRDAAASCYFTVSDVDTWNVRNFE